MGRVLVTSLHRTCGCMQVLNELPNHSWPSEDFKRIRQIKAANRVEMRAQAQ